MRRLLIAFAMPLLAMAGTVTFDGFVDPNPLLASATDIQGLTFASNHFHVINDTACSLGGCVPGVPYLGVDAPSLGLPVTVTLTGGGTFSLLSLDTAVLWADGAASILAGFANGDNINLLGTLSGGGTISTSFALGSTFATHALTGWDNLVSVRLSASTVTGITNASFAADNLVFSTGGEPPPPPPEVPEPATVGLFGAGLAIVLAARRLRG